MPHSPPPYISPLPKESLHERAAREGRAYADAGWTNCDEAAAAWLGSGRLSAVACEAEPVAAERAFIRGFRSARSAAMGRR